MNLYNLINSCNPCVFLVVPMLGKHPDEYPRFRDCFLEDDEHPEHSFKIQIYTRVGGGNRETYKEEIEILRNMPGYITDYDDTFDSTYATFVYDVPEKWSKDFKAIMETNFSEVSMEYIDQICLVFPKIAEKIMKEFAESRTEKRQTEAGVIH